MHTIIRGMVAAVLILAGTAAATAAPSTTAQAAPAPQPNILLITTDDQSMSDLRWMPRTSRLLGQGGVTFPRSISPHPLCCPARAEILTGQFAQNSGVRHNRGPYGGYKVLKERNTLATWLDGAGYRTAYVGKFLNGYRAADGRVPGFDIWNPTIKNVYGYFDYTMFNNGRFKHYSTLHNADLVGQKTVEYIRQLSGRRPFFIWASQVAPHTSCATKETCWQPPLPARRHRNVLADAVSPSVTSPSFNEADVSDKPGYIQDLPLRDPDDITYQFRQRIRSLQAVDDSVADAVRALNEAGELANTVILFTSDNGFLLGEHRFYGKDVPYEEALQVPMLMRGPGIPQGVSRPQTVTTVDIAPTIADLANVRPGLTVDGRSMLPMAKSSSAPSYDTVLIQAGTSRQTELENDGWRYRGVRTARYTYVYFATAGTTELYDRRRDPNQLRNVSGDPRYAAIEAELTQRALLLGECAGSCCRQRFGPLPKPLAGR